MADPRLTGERETGAMASEIPGVDYPLLEDYDDLLLYEFHMAGILTKQENEVQQLAKRCNENSFINRFKLFPPMSLNGELTPISGG